MMSHRSGPLSKELRKAQHDVSNEDKDWPKNSYRAEQKGLCELLTLFLGNEGCCYGRRDLILCLLLCLLLCSLSPA